MPDCPPLQTAAYAKHGMRPSFKQTGEYNVTSQEISLIKLDCLQLKFELFEASCLILLFG